MVPDKLRSKDRERLTKAAARAHQMAEEGYIPEEDEKPGKSFGHQVKSAESLPSTHCFGEVGLKFSADGDCNS